MEAIAPVNTNQTSSAAQSVRETLRQTANEVVGSVFYGTMLRQMRASNLKGEFGHGGRGEEVFQAQLDQLFAQEAGKSRTTTVSDALVDRLEKQALAIERYKENQRSNQQSTPQNNDVDSISLREEV